MGTQTRSVFLAVVVIATAGASSRGGESNPLELVCDGIVRGKPARQLVLPAPDQPEHVLGLVETTGSFECSPGSVFLSGALVSTIETWDFVAGNGVDRGYIVFSVESDRLVGRYVGDVSRGEADRVALKGDIVFETGTGRFAGVTGHVSYVGWAQPDVFELKLTGRCERQEEQAQPRAADNPDDAQR